MIKDNIITNFHNHFFVNSSDDLYISDYTDSTKNLALKRSVEIFTPIPCNDNEYFSVLNPNNLEIESVVFNNSSFLFSNGSSKSQCETFTFPATSTADTWLLFVELKYGLNPLKNGKNLRKAIKQLFKTRYHYIQSNVFKKHENVCYLLGSLPKQREPFANFALTPSYLSNLKLKHNIILRMKNSVEIENSKLIFV